MREAHIRAKAIDFALHLAVTRRAGGDTPIRARDVLKDAQVFLGFLQGQRPTRLRLAASMRRNKTGVLHEREPTWDDMVELATSRLAQESRESRQATCPECSATHGNSRPGRAST